MQKYLKFINIFLTIYIIGCSEKKDDKKEEVISTFDLSQDSIFLNDFIALNLSDFFSSVYSLENEYRRIFSGNIRCENSLIADNFERILNKTSKTIEADSSWDNTITGTFYGKNVYTGQTDCVELTVKMRDSSPLKPLHITQTGDKRYNFAHFESSSQTPEIATTITGSVNNSYLLVEESRGEKFSDTFNLKLDEKKTILFWPGKNFSNLPYNIAGENIILSLTRDNINAQVTDFNILEGSFTISGFFEDQKIIISLPSAELRNCTLMGVASVSLLKGNIEIKKIQVDLATNLYSFSSSLGEEETIKNYGCSSY